MSDTPSNGWTADRVREQMAWSPRLELWTIPLYLSAAYSIDLSEVWGTKQPHIGNLPDNNTTTADGLPVKDPACPDDPYHKYSVNDLKQACFNVIMSVGIQEMFHMELAANVCNAIGSDIEFGHAVAPKYVGTPAEIVPQGLGAAAAAPAIKAVQAQDKSGTGTINQPLTKELIDIFLWVEHEQSPPDSTNYQESYPSIGSFYDALTVGVNGILSDDSKFAELYPPAYYSGSGEPTDADLRQKDAFNEWPKRMGADPEYKFKTQISGSVENAKKLIDQAILAIVDQGEGAGSDGSNVNPLFVPTDTEYGAETKLDELTHYERFAELQNIWAAVEARIGTGNATYPGDAATGENSAYVDILQQTFSSFTDAMTTDFTTADTTLNLTAMSGVGARIFDVWAQGAVPNFEYVEFETWMAAKKKAYQEKWGGTVPAGKELVFHSCQGLNECKYQDVGMTAEEAGVGQCALAWNHVCGGTNNCANQGGCGYAVDPGANPQGAPVPYVATGSDNWIPSQNDCSQKGGCGSPIPDAQTFNAEDNFPVPPTDRQPHPTLLGPNTSVWTYARALFEDRMNAKTPPVPFGDAPAANSLRKGLSTSTNN